MTTQDQVNQILATLGTDPEGVYANVRVRLDIIEARINNPNVPAPVTTNPFYIDGYGGVSISVGDGYPTEDRSNGSMYLRRDGAVTEGMYLRRSGVWELVASSSSSIHNNLSGLQGGETDGYYHLTSNQYTWLTDGYAVGYWEETKGGTGQITYTTGDILYSDGSNSLAKLGIGTANQILQISGGIPSWQDLSGTLVEAATGNVAGGTGALSDLTTGDYNTAFGYNSGDSITSQNNNTLIGFNAGKNIRDHGNTAVGYNAIGSGSGATIQWNTAVGYRALDYADGAATTRYCVAIGYNAGIDVSSGDNKILIGTESGTGNSGSGSICIGSYTGGSWFKEYSIALGAYARSLGIYSIAIGYSAQANEDYSMVIGYDTITSKGAYTATLGYPSLFLGKNAAEDITIYAYNADANLPYLKYNESTSKWVYSNDGTSESDIGSGGGGVSDHNALSNLQGGQADGYYHLTPTQHTWLTDGYTDGYWKETKGGTGQTTYTTGDILYADGSNSLNVLNIGTAGQALRVSGSIPSWQDLTGTLIEIATQNVGGGTNSLGSISAGNGNYNTAFGYNSGNAITTGDYNICIGAATNSLNTGSNNVILASQNGPAITYGTKNVLIGDEVAKNSNSLDSNVFVGYTVGAAAINNCLRNVYIGNYCAWRLSGNQNENIAIGTSTLSNSTSATISNCVAIGRSTLDSISGTTTDVVAIGEKAATSLTSGVDAVFIGYYSGQTYSGSGAISVGARSGATTNAVGVGYYGIASGSGSIAIGYYTTASHTQSLVIGYGSSGTPFVSKGDNTAALDYHSLYLGRDTAEDIIIYAHNADTNLPYLKYNESTSKWVYSNDGVSESDIGSGGGSSDHNTLSNLQGGETDGYYHLTPTQHTNVVSSFYTDWYDFTAARYSDGYFYVSTTLSNELTYLMRKGMPIRYGDSSDLSDGYYAVVNSVAGTTATYNGTATAGTVSSITLESDVTSAVVDQIIEITGGTGSGQTRRIVSLATYTATVDTNWSTTPDATSTYQTYPTAGIAGPPIATDHDGYFQYSNNSKISSMSLFLQSTYASASSTTLLNDIIGTDILWTSPVAHLVKFDVYNKTNDSGASKPNVNVTLNGNAVSTSNSNNGLEVSTTHNSTTTDINVSNYTIEFTEEIEVSTDAAGTNNDAEDLTVTLIFVIE